MAQHKGKFPKVHQMALGDTSPDHGEINELRHLYGLDVEAIVTKVLNIIEEGK